MTGIKKSLKNNDRHIFFIVVLGLSKFSFVVFQDKHMANFNTVSKTMLLARKCLVLFMLPNNLEFTCNYYIDRILKH